MSRFGVGHLNQWKRIGAPQLVLRWLEHGVELPFRGNTPPATFHLPNDISAADEGFVNRHTDMWVNNGIVERVRSSDNLKAISPLTIANRSGNSNLLHSPSARLLLNLKVLNESIDSPNLKGENLISTLRERVRPNDWMVKFDLESGFSQLCVHRKSTPYLGFMWNDRFYQYTALPAGLSISPFCFNTTMQVVVNHIAKTFNGRGVRFMDDWLMAADDVASTERLSEHVSELFEQLGLKLSGKTMVRPVRKLTFVGISIDTTDDVKLSLPRSRLEQLQIKVSDLLANADVGPVAASSVAHLCGSLIESVQRGGPQELSEVKSLTSDLKQKNDDGVVTLSSQSLEDLVLISELLDCLISQ